MAQTHPCTVCRDPLTDEEGVYATTARNAEASKHGEPLHAWWVCVTCMMMNDAVHVPAGLGKS